jgi:hypothetical protein
MLPPQAPLALNSAELAAAYAALPPLLQQVNFGAPITVSLNFLFLGSKYGH